LADLHGYEKYIITTLLSESIPSPNSVCDHTNCRGNMQYFVNKARQFKQLHCMLSIDLAAFLNDVFKHRLFTNVQ